MKQDRQSLSGQRSFTGSHAEPQVSTRLGNTRLLLSARGASQVATEAFSAANGALLDYAGAADYLCTTPRHVRELWAKRYLTGIKVGRRVRFCKSDLDAYIEARRVNAIR